MTYITDIIDQFFFLDSSLAHNLDRAWHIQYQMFGLTSSRFHKFSRRGENCQVDRVNNLSLMLDNFTGSWLQIFFSPLPGEMIQFD